MFNALSPEVLVQVLDTMSVRLFWKDRDSRYLGCNRHFAEDASVADPIEFVGRSDYFFYQPEQAAAFRLDDADVMFTGKPKLGILEKITKDSGQVIWLDTSKWPLRNADGEIIGVIGMYQDITERVEADSERCRACVSLITAA
ncbi:PAS domain-containing protein [Terricaulis sp.]|uniref:PAS domain-containing protein n=1 Tax=Terricaulis sp. TaxID=2768686 RepID=UPI002AC3965A|nr:PAS domain-containing protein [Terricaulis sp.]MDZ4689963.1 PAS domain-containing protein [Terricaulis sp.]